jgi:hypothetical protein
MRTNLRLQVGALVRTLLTSAATILTLALGIGVTTMIFSGNATMLPPAVARQHRLMDLSMTVTGADSPEPELTVWSYRYLTMSLQRSTRTSRSIRPGRTAGRQR